MALVVFSVFIFYFFGVFIFFGLGVNCRYGFWLLVLYFILGLGLG
jgi:hypothetical protein